LSSDCASQIIRTDQTTMNKLHSYNIYKLRDWIDINKLDWIGLSLNPNAIDLLERNLDKVVWSFMCENPNAVSLLEKNPEKIDWYHLSKNPGAIRLIEKNLDKIDSIRGGLISLNENAVHILEKNHRYICWNWLAMNPGAIRILEHNLYEMYYCIYLSSNPNAIHLLHKSKLDWYWLSTNPNAIHIIEKNMDKVDWAGLSANPKAIHLIQKHMDMISWEYLCSNPHSDAMRLLEENQDKIDMGSDPSQNWIRLSSNPYIFTYNYCQMKENMKKSGIAEGIMKHVWNPERLMKICQKYNIEFHDLI